MRDHTHHSHTDDGVCALCGQPLPVVGVSEYGQRKPNRTGIAVTIGLHLLLIAIYLLQPNRERHAAPPAGATTFSSQAGVASPDSKWPGARRASMPAEGVIAVERMPSGTAMRARSSAS